jgi:hypothetical protein
MRIKNDMTTKKKNPSKLLNKPKARQLPIGTVTNTRLETGLVPARVMYQMRRDLLVRLALQFQKSDWLGL